MNKKSVITILPTLPPVINGLGDYGYILANKLYLTHQVSNTFICTDNNFSLDESFPFKANFLPDHSAQNLYSLLQREQPEFILLHYVGYAYSSIGCPSWLVKGIKTYLNKNRSCKLITIFHELYAGGTPLHKSFYTLPFQKKIAFDLYHLSSGAITNTDITFKILKEKNDQKTLLMLPVFSNAGEIISLEKHEGRENALVIFGSASLRKKIFDNQEELLFWITQLKIEKVIEIGPARSDQKKLTFPGYEHRGTLEMEEVSALLRKSKYGMISYPEHLLTKSGVFASYIAHGLIPIVVGSMGKIESNKYLYLSNKNNIHRSPDEIIRSNFETYNLSNQNRTANTVFEMLNEL